MSEAANTVFCFINPKGLDTSKETDIIKFSHTPKKIPGYSKAIIEYICHADLMPVKNIYKIKIFSRDYRKLRAYNESIFNVLADEGGDRAPRINLYAVMPKNTVSIVKSGTIMNYKNTEMFFGGEVLNGVEVTATDTLSYYLEKIRPEKPTESRDIKSTLQAIFRSDKILKKYSTRIYSTVTGNKRINFEENVTIKDMLDSFCRLEDCHWTVIDDKLYIGKSITVQSTYTNQNLSAAYLTKATLTPIWYRDPFHKKDQNGDIKSYVDYIINGRATYQDLQFVNFDLLPGTVMHYDNRGLPYTYGGKGKILITSVIQTFYGASEATIEGLKVDNESEHRFRYVMSQGPTNSRKRLQNQLSRIEHSFESHPSFLVGSIVSGSNGLFKVRIGQEEKDLTGKGTALSSVPEKSPVVFENVPLMSPYGEVGSNSSDLPDGTQVVLGFNRHNLNDPFIMGILQKQGTLPYIRITNNTLELCGDALGVARETDSVDIWAAFKTWLNSHTHPTAALGPPSMPTVGFDPTSTAPKIGTISSSSSKVKCIGD